MIWSGRLQESEGGGHSEVSNLDDLRQKLRGFAQQRDWEQFHTPKNIAIALSVEASELLEIFQWLSDAQSQDLTPKQRESIAQEIGDVMNYLVRFCDLVDLDPIECAEKKIDLNEQKYPADLVRGSSAKYTAYLKDDA